MLVCLTLGSYVFFQNQTWPQFNKKQEVNLNLFLVQFFCEFYTCKIHVYMITVFTYSPPLSLPPPTLPVSLCSLSAGCFSLGSHSLPIAVHLRVGTCKIFLIYIDMSAPIVIRKPPLLWCSLNLRCRACNIDVPFGIIYPVGYSLCLLLVVYLCKKPLLLLLPKQASLKRSEMILICG